MIVDFPRETTPGDVVTVIATQPLTGNERWNVLAPGAFIVFEGGEPVWQHGAPSGCAAPATFAHPA